VNCWIYTSIFFFNLCFSRTFAICCRPSVCRLSVVCNACAPYSVGWNFRPATDVHGKFYGDRPRGTHPLRRGFKRKRGSQI